MADQSFYELLTAHVHRPQLLHHSSIASPPIMELGSELSLQLESSLKSPLSDGNACAESARLWESLLETHRLPFILLLVADMQYYLGTKVTALRLYAELQTTLQDPDLKQWIDDCQTTIMHESDRQLHAFKTDLSLGFTQEQRWRPSAKDVFPDCVFDPSRVDYMRSEWIRYKAKKNTVEAVTMRYHCLETNILEDTFEFDTADSLGLTIIGFFDEKLLYSSLSPPISGEVRSTKDAFSILQDTHNALEEVLKKFRFGIVNLTVDDICRLHAILMRTSRVLYCTSPSGGRLSHLNIGVTRSASRANVMASTSMSGRPVTVQFCPWDEVDAELHTFCERFNELLSLPDRDPFASAAWISHVFVSIHPFEDGNGRLSRMLASIPMIRSGLPILTLPAGLYKHRYIVCLNKVRAKEDEAYPSLMKTLHDATHTASLSSLIFARSDSIC